MIPVLMNIIANMVDEIIIIFLLISDYSENGPFY